MFYRDDQETIISSVDQHGDAVMTWVTQHHKLESFRFINSRIENAVRDQDIVLTYKNEWCHSVAETINRAPMYCNFLTSRGYQNILFVGHFWVGQYNWLHPRKEVDPTSGMLYPFPPERDNKPWYPDIDVITQFIPIIHRLWNYSPKITIVRPPEPRHKGVVHHLYNLFKVSENLIESNKQYKHGEDTFELLNWEPQNSSDLFDAVVFAGVPMKDGDQSFQLSQLKEIFNPYVTSNCEYVDIYQNQGVDGDTRFFRNRDREQDVTGSLGAVITARAVWDRETRNQGRKEEYGFLKNQIRVFR